MVPAPFSVHPLPGLPIVQPGDDLVALIEAGLGRAGLALQEGDVLVIAQKIVSRAEDRFRRLADVIPNDAAMRLAADVDKDPRLVALILEESTEIVRKRAGLLIARHRLGLVMANAGIDASNVGETDTVLLLPVDPDATCRVLRHRLGGRIAVVVNDSVGRAWRRGTVGFAIGCAGLRPVVSMRGQPDLFGRPLQTTEIALADEIAAAASLVMGQAAEASPVVLIRGLGVVTQTEAPAGELVRPLAEDLFR